MFFKHALVHNYNRLILILKSIDYASIFILYHILRNRLQ